MSFTLQTICELSASRLVDWLRWGYQLDKVFFWSIRYQNNEHNQSKSVNKTWSERLLKPVLIIIRRFRRENFSMDFIIQLNKATVASSYFSGDRLPACNFQICLKISSHSFSLLMSTGNICCKAESLWVPLRAASISKQCIITSLLEAV